MSPELSQLLQYDNSSVVTHFCHHHSEYSLPEGRALFKDLLAWMWLSKQRSRDGKPTYLFGPLLILDELWHVFIIHTRQYTDFSMSYFGEYMHHEVEPIGFEHLLEESELTDYLEDCFKYLDEDWVKRRFAVVFQSAE